MKTPCGKTYKKGAWYNKHIRECKECQKIKKQHNALRFTAVTAGVLIVVISFWVTK